MKPWERRLRDLAHLLGTCATTYFDPDLFRMNVNQFLQTSRTITFIIQKHKSSIPNFSNWYPQNVEDAWKTDVVMTWAKDARNKIEKEGDLDLHSSLRTTLLFSYLENEDLVIDSGRDELLYANAYKLINLAEKVLPAGISDAAVVKIERRWVTASLPDWELLEALSYIYAKVHRCCLDLALHLGTTIDPSIPTKVSFAQARESACKVQYVKFRGRTILRYVTESNKIDQNFALPERFRAVVDDALASGFSPSSLEDLVNYYADLAKISFEHFGNHVPIAFIFDSQWHLIDMLSTNFGDQADKYIFWRMLGDRVAGINAHALVWISESWLRDAKQPISTPIRQLPILGERLHVIGFDITGSVQQVSWTINRTEPNASPTLVKDEHQDKADAGAMPFFFVPVMRAMGMADPAYIQRASKKA